MNPVRSKKSKISADSQNANRTSNGMKKKQFIAIVLSLALVALFLPVSSVRAQFERPFGGIVSLSIPCTCPGSAGNTWIWFTPLYLGGPVVITGPVVYSRYATLPFANFNIAVPSRYHAGYFTPGVQACWMTIVTGCIPLPNLGLMFYVGTN